MLKTAVLCKKRVFEVLTSRCNLHFIGIKDYGTLYVTYPIFSSYIDGLYGVILPVFFMRVKS